MRTYLVSTFTCSVYAAIGPSTLITSPSSACDSEPYGEEARAIVDFVKQEVNDAPDGHENFLRKAGIKLPQADHILRFGSQSDEVKTFFAITAFTYDFDEDILNNENAAKCVYSDFFSGVVERCRGLLAEGAKCTELTSLLEKSPFAIALFLKYHSHEDPIHPDEVDPVSSDVAERMEDLESVEFDPESSLEDVFFMLLVTRRFRRASEWNFLRDEDYERRQSTTFEGGMMSVSIVGRNCTYAFRGAISDETKSIFAGGKTSILPPGATCIGPRMIYEDFEECPGCAKEITIITPTEYMVTCEEIQNFGAFKYTTTNDRLIVVLSTFKKAFADKICGLIRKSTQQGW